MEDTPISKLKPIHVTIGFLMVLISLAFSTGIVYNRLANVEDRVTKLEDLRQADEKFHNETMVSLEKLLDFSNRQERLNDRYIRDFNDPERKTK